MMSNSVGQLPSVLAAAAEQLDHVRQEEASHIHEVSSGGGACWLTVGGGAYQLRSHHLQNH